MSDVTCTCGKCPLSAIAAEARAQRLEAERDEARGRAGRIAEGGDELAATVAKMKAEARETDELLRDLVGQRDELQRANQTLENGLREMTLVAVTRMSVDSLTSQIAQLRDALREALDLASSNVGRCSQLSDFVGRGALVDTATCNNLMPCPTHGEDPRIATLRSLLTPKETT